MYIDGSTLDCHWKSTSHVRWGRTYFVAATVRLPVFEKYRRGFWRAGRVAVSQHITHYGPRSGFLHYNLTPPIHHMETPQAALWILDLESFINTLSANWRYIRTFCLPYRYFLEVLDSDLNEVRLASPFKPSGYHFVCV